MPLEPKKGAIRTDKPLSNLAMAAFNSGMGFIAEMIFRTVKVVNESDQYYVIDKKSWLQIPDALRSRKTAPRSIAFRLSKEKYDCQHWSLRDENAKEDLVNPDNAVMLRQQSTLNVVDALLRDREFRAAQTLSDVNNFGGNLPLAGNTQFSDYVNSDPDGVVKDARTSMRLSTGLSGNTVIVDATTHDTLKRHPDLLDKFKYKKSGLLGVSELAEIFEVEEYLVGSQVYNPGNFNEGVDMTGQNIWGNNLILAYIDKKPVSMKTKTFTLGFRWTPKGFPSAFATTMYDHPDPGVASEYVASGYHADEKVVAKDLGYLISNTV